MRIGMNPNRKANLPAPARVVVAVITHLPNMTSDYHRQRLEVVKKSIKTLTDNINMPPADYDLIVWDNGSCHELREWLDGFVCKRFYTNNIGKINALKSIMRMLRPDTILAYGDDDMEYMPNWLAPQIEILETYPNVGTVTGYPVRLMGAWGEISTLTWARLNAEVEVGKLIPDEWDKDYCRCVGRDYESYKTMTWGYMDTRITHKGVQAYALSQHCQFVCYPERIEPLVNWTDKAMADEIAFDRIVDVAGLLRLSTVERYTRHMGNVLE